MKTIKGIEIKNSNFEKFKKVADLIYFLWATVVTLCNRQWRQLFLLLVRPR